MVQLGIWTVEGGGVRDKDKDLIIRMVDCNGEHLHHPRESGPNRTEQNRAEHWREYEPTRDKDSIGQWPSLP